MSLVREGGPFPRLELQQRGTRFDPPHSPAGTLFYFMRTGDCPVCRAHVRRLAQLFPELKADGFSVVVVTPEAKGALEVESSIAPPFPVVWGSQAHRGLGLGRVLFGTIQQSGTAVVDAEGLVLLLVRATLPTGAFPEDEVLELVKKHARR